jgi:hypothetical protein
MRKTVPKGAFRVYRDQQDPRDIHFESIAPDSPEEQLRLKDDVEQALIVLRGLFPDGKGRFEDYFRPLLSLAQCGLVGDAANTGVAARALASLKAEVTAREGGTVKNRYMKTLGLRAALVGGPTLVLALVLLHFAPRYGILANFLVLWSGCMAGVWLSFGARKATFRFEDLHIPEQDRLEPMIRLFFAGFLTVILALLFSVGAVSVTLGSITTSSINSQFRVALLVGMLCGFSEQILSSKVAKQASALLDFAKN